MMPCLRRPAALFLAVSCALAGCTPMVRVTYLSDPPGATVYAGGQPLGPTPFTAAIPADKAYEAGGCMPLGDASVRWVSGAQAALTGLAACAAAGPNLQFMFVRPDVPGRDKDAMFALELERNALLRAQAEAQQRQAEAQMRQAEAMRAQARAQREQAAAQREAAAAQREANRAQQNPPTTGAAPAGNPPGQPARAPVKPKSD